jgi:uncharacterized membrane protein
MQNLIEPNLHPLVVHFVIAFLVTGPLLLLYAAFRGDGENRERIKFAGDLIFSLGIVSLVVGLGAGLQAYYSVNHDGPSHAAMTDHRNWAFVTAAIFIGLAAWRFINRAEMPSKTFVIVLLLPLMLLTITGWKGGHLVYGLGLGVESLPVVTGDGHDHDHGEAVEHPLKAQSVMGGDKDDHKDNPHPSSAMSNHVDSKMESDIETEILDEHSEMEAGHGHGASGNEQHHDGAPEVEKEVVPAAHDHSGHEH